MQPSWRSRTSHPFAIAWIVLAVLVYAGLVLFAGAGGPGDLIGLLLALTIASGAVLLWVVPRVIYVRIRSGRPFDQRDAIWIAFAALVVGWLAWSIAGGGAHGRP